MSKARNIIAIICITLGAALLIAAIAVPVYMVPKVKVIPLDTSAKTQTKTVPGTLLSAGALAKNEPLKQHKSDPDCKDKEMPVKCFIDNEIEIYGVRQVTAQEPSDEQNVTFQVGNTTMKKGEPSVKNLISATIDRMTLNRKTAFPVKDPVSTISVNAPLLGVQDSTAPFTRDGYQYQFPFGTERRSYPYFDIYTGKSTPIDFVKATQQKGTTAFKDGAEVYEFTQTLGPVDLFDTTTELLHRDGKLSEADKATLASLRLQMPARVWGLEGDEKINMDRYYYNTRTIRVEPTTGVITYGSEKVWMFYAKDQAEADELAKPENMKRELAKPQRTALYFPATWDEATQNRQLKKAEDGIGPLNLLSKIVPWVAGIGGVIFLLLGFFLYFGNRRRVARKRD